MHAWAQYAYPPSPEGSPLLLDPTSGTRPIPLSQRLRALQNELLALENELADPANPLLQKEREEEHVDPGELIRGLVDVRTRLDKIKKGKEGRAPVGKCRCRWGYRLEGEGEHEATYERKGFIV